MPVVALAMECGAYAQEAGGKAEFKEVRDQAGRPGFKAAGQRQRATVLMFPDPTLLALQEQNGFADAVVTGDEIVLSGVITS